MHVIPVRCATRIIFSFANVTQLFQELFCTIRIQYIQKRDPSLCMARLVSVLLMGVVQRARTKMKRDTKKNSASYIIMLHRK